jgi:hypothetical protein
MRGFLVFDHMDRVPDAMTELANWASEAKLKDQIDVVDGLENAPGALNRLLAVQNLGKQLVRCRGVAPTLDSCTRNFMGQFAEASGPGRPGAHEAAPETCPAPTVNGRHRLEPHSAGAMRHTQRTGDGGGAHTRCRPSNWPMLAMLRRPTS